MTNNATTELLTHVRTFEPQRQTTTTNEDYFREAGVVSMGDNFRAQFLGLEISPAPLNILAVHNLEEPSLDKPILEVLGDKAEVSITEFKAFLAGNHKSKEWFIFYLRGRDGNLWAVHAYWRHDDGWRVGAGSFGRARRWRRGGRVVSRN